MRTRPIRKQFWFTEEEAKELKMKAIKVGLTESDVIRSLIMDYRPKEKPPKEFYYLILELRKIGININQIAKKANSIGFIDNSYYKNEIKKIDNIIESMKEKYLYDDIIE